jgi:predicted phage-related endonuclease
MDVWLEKTGKRIDQKDSFALRFGSFAESFVADEYALTTGEILVCDDRPVVHPDYDYCVGHVDRYVVKDPDQPLWGIDWKINAKKLLECKTANYFSQGEWGEVGTDAIPLPYLCQCLWYLELTGVSHIDVAVLLGGSDLRIYSITEDQELQTLLVQKAVHFWTEYVLKDIPPPPQSISDCQTLFARAVPGKTMEASPETLRLISQLQSLEKDCQAHEEQIEGIKQMLMERMGDAEVLAYQGTPLITWKTPKPSYRIDTKRLSLEHPELIKAYQSPIQSSRCFVVKDLPSSLEDPLFEKVYPSDAQALGATL